MKTILTDEQVSKAAKWEADHPCDIMQSGAIGGKTTYSFTQTSMGRVEKVSCACGEELDLTGYETW